MQTFLPYPDFAQSAAALDRQRLGKQRVECLQILRTLCGESHGWANHPAVRMWSRNASALLHYGLIVCAEWRGRGYRDNCEREMLDLHVDTYHGGLTPLPSWLGREDFHASHRSNLLRKNPEHYRQFGWREPPNLPYVWPEAS